MYLKGEAERLAAAGLSHDEILVAFDLLEETRSYATYHAWISEALGRAYPPLAEMPA